MGGDYWFFDNIGSLTTIISSFVLLSNVFWNAVDRIIKSWIFFLKVKVSYCCNTRLLKLTELCRPLGHDMCSSPNPEGCCLPTHSRPTCGGTPDLQIQDCLKMHQI